MNPKDLMIGNWVMTPYGPYQVDIIYDNGKVSAGLIELASSELNGIQLTPEILEKNRFSRKGHDHYHLEFGDYGALASYPRFGGYTGIFFQYKDTSLRSEIRYVHELQNTLRLCRIDKEIEL